MVVKDVTEGRGDHSQSGDSRRTPVRIDMLNEFEYTVAEIGRGWTKTSRPIKFDLVDSYAQFAEIHLCQSGIVR